MIDGGLGAVDAAEQNGDFSEGAKLVLVGDGHQEGAGLLEVSGPGRLVETPAIEVELVGLVEQFESATVVLIFAEIESDGSLRVLKETVERNGVAVGCVAQSLCAADAV